MSECQDKTSLDVDFRNKARWMERVSSTMFLKARQTSLTKMMLRSGRLRMIVSTKSGMEKTAMVAIVDTDQEAWRDDVFLLRVASSRCEAESAIRTLVTKIG